MGVWAWGGGGCEVGVGVVIGGWTYRLTLGGMARP